MSPMAAMHQDTTIFSEDLNANWRLDEQRLTYLRSREESTRWDIEGGDQGVGIFEVIFDHTTVPKTWKSFLAP